MLILLSYFLLMIKLWCSDTDASFQLWPHSHSHRSTPEPLSKPFLWATVHWGLSCYSASWTPGDQIVSSSIHFDSSSLNEICHLSQRDHRLCVRSLFHPYFMVLLSNFPSCPPSGLHPQQVAWAGRCVYSTINSGWGGVKLFLKQVLNVDAHLQMHVKVWLL